MEIYCPPTAGSWPGLFFIFSNLWFYFLMTKYGKSYDIIMCYYKALLIGTSTMVVFLTEVLFLCRSYIFLIDRQAIEFVSLVVYKSSAHAINSDMADTFFVLVADWLGR